MIVMYIMNLNLQIIYFSILVLYYSANIYQCFLILQNNLKFKFLIYVTIRIRIVTIYCIVIIYCIY